MKSLNNNPKDIPYNFLIGDDGFIYEGRGYRYQGEITTTSSVSSYDDIGIFVAFIGTYNDAQPSNVQNNSLNEFLKHSVRRDMVAIDYIILSQDQLTLSESPAKGILEFAETRSDFYSCRYLFEILKVTLTKLIFSSPFSYESDPLGSEISK